MTDTPNHIETIRDLTAAASVPTTAEGDFVTLPPGFTVHDLEKYQPAPNRLKRSLSFATHESFSEYVNRWKAEERTELAASLQSTTLTAVLDGHAPGEPSWCEHKAMYPCPLDRRWVAWTGQNRKRLNQHDFAEWIEDHVEDIIEPAGPELLDAAKHIQIHRNAEFNSRVELVSGEFNFAFSENNAAGSVRLPAEFALQLQVFQHGDHYKVPCRLRYRLSDGKLTLWFEIIEPEKYVEDGFEDVLTKVQAATGLTALRIL